MEGAPWILLTVLSLAGTLLAAVACVAVLAVLVAAVIIVAIRQRRNAAPPAQPAA